MFFCLKSQRFIIYKKSVDTLLGKTLPGNLLIGRGKFSLQKNDKFFGNFFPDEIYSNRVVIPMYCTQFIDINMCHIKLKADAGTERFLKEKFFEISEIPDRYALQAKFLKKTHEGVPWLLSVILII